MAGVTKDVYLGRYREFDVKRFTLRDNYNRSLQGGCSTTDGRSALSEDQEKVLLEQIGFLALRGIFYTPVVLRNMAAVITGKMPSASWARRFVEKHRESLSCLISQGMESTRHTAEYRPTFDAYFDLVSGHSHQNDADSAQLEKVCSEGNIRANNIYNMDEKGFLMGKTKLKGERTSRKSHPLEALHVVYVARHSYNKDRAG